MTTTDPRTDMTYHQVLVDTPVDASDPVQLRHAAAVVRAVWEDTDSADELATMLAYVSSALAARADRLDTDTKDRALAEKIAREKFNLNKRPVIAEFDNQNESVRDGYLSAALAGIKAGRNAAKAGA